MLLTLENIQNQQFNQRFRGYDMAEVDAFLDKIAESYLFLSTENSKTKEELSGIKNERSQSLEEEQSFKNAIISAQSFADDIKIKAENQAQRLKEDAKEKSTQILEDAQNSVNSLNDQISILAGEKERIKTELRDLLNTYLSQIDDDSIATPKQINPPAEVVGMDQIPEFQNKVDLEPAIATQETSDEKKADDVAILYEKIDLDDDGIPAVLLETPPSEAPQAMEMELNSDEFATNELDDLEGLDMPDLDGDMLYSLEDPLDSAPEPAVTIDPLKDEK